MAALKAVSARTLEEILVDLLHEISKAQSLAHINHAAAAALDALTGLIG